MCQWMMKVCLPWTHQDIRTIQRNTIHFQKETRSTLTRGQIYCQALEILGNRFEIMSENKTKETSKKNLLQETNLKKKKEKKSNRRFGSFWPAISKYPKRKTNICLEKFPRVVYQKKILEHTTLSPFSYCTVRGLSF